MPKRTDIKSILIIGAGPIVIGQACEFDYSGTQACKALKAEGYRIVLVNSNPATIMTDPELADATYIEPITPEIVAKIIEKERPDALLPTMGGQTALNTALSLKKMGVLDKFNVKMIGATAEAIDKAEDRELFRNAMTKIGLETPRSHQIKTLAQALEALEDIGLPAIIRPSLTMRGTGGGIAYNKDDLIIIAMNPRVSRSSAMASKATGFPIDKVAAKLAVGYTLDEIANDITGGATPASFEPTIDYVVTKIPRFAFEKFPGADATLTTSMKSVGEAMAIVRTFQESLQKALRSLETGLTGLDEITLEGLGQGDDKNAIRAALGSPTQDGLLKVAQAMRLGFSDAEIHSACKVDPWFLAQVRGIVDTEAEIRAKGLPKTAGAFRRLKAMGVSDARLGKLTGSSAEAVTHKRHALDVRPVVKRIDTCAAEFASPTAYLHSSYETPFAGQSGSHIANEARPTDKKKVIILGGGPNRIGQGIEFDYCCCHAAFALKEVGYETIMINCNPETVSTD